MNLLHILPRLPAPPNDGGAVYVYNMLRELEKLGHELTIVSLISNKHEQDLKMIEAIGDVYAEDGQFKPYSIHSVLKSFISRQPITVQHRMKTDIMKSLLSQVNKQPDVILLEGLHSAAFLEQARQRFPGVPVVLRQVNVEHQLLKRNGVLNQNLLKKWFYFDQAKLMKRFELQKMQDADYVTAISQNDIDNYKSDLPNSNFFLNTAGANVPDEIDEQRDPKMMFTVSNWRWQPNLDGLEWFMEEIWPIIHNKLPNIHFHVAGDGLTDSFKHRFSSSHIHYLGFVDDIDSLRQKASVFVAPLLSGSGMKLKVLEGLAAGLPTVTTRFGSEGIEIENKIHFLQADNAEQFSRAVISLFEDNTLKNSLSIKGKERIKSKYSWKRKGRELSDYLEHIAHKE